MPQNIKRIVRLLFLLTITFSCNNSSQVRVPTNGTRETFDDLNPLLRKGTYHVGYYASKETTDQQKKLLRKLINLIETNKKTRQFFDNVIALKNPKFDPGIGISKNEYDDLLDLFSYKKPDTKKGTILISVEDDVFSFKGEGRLSLLDSVSINIKKKIASFKQYRLSIVTDSIDVTNEDIPKGDTLKRFSLFQGPDGPLGLTKLGGEYELLIGRLIPSGRTYLSLFVREPGTIEHPIPEYITVIFEQ